MLYKTYIPISIAKVVCITNMHFDSIYITSDLSGNSEIVFYSYPITRKHSPRNSYHLPCKDFQKILTHETPIDKLSGRSLSPEAKTLFVYVPIDEPHRHLEEQLRQKRMQDNV